MAKRHRKFLVRPLLKVERLELGCLAGAHWQVWLGPSDALKTLNFILKRLIGLLIVFVLWSSSLGGCCCFLLLFLLQLNLKI